VRLAAVGLASLGTMAVAGCGSTEDVPGAAIRGNTLTVYVSVPLQGPSAVSGTSVVNGAELALARSHDSIGRYRIVLRALDDATAARAEWDPGQTTTTARAAVRDPTAVGYIGDLDSGASAISLPILNRGGIAQISPTSTAVGLTSSGPGAAPGEPEKYYPTGTRTFARVAPNDSVQAAAQVSLQQSYGCTRTFVLDDGEVDGEDMAISFDLAARSTTLQVIGTQQYAQRAANYTALAAGVASSGANCVLISAITDSGAALVTREIAAAIPGVRIFATGGLAESTYASAIPAGLDARIIITAPVLGASAYPSSGQQLLADYTARYGPPEPDAILGYEAMSLMLDAIDRATGHGRHAARRAAVVRAIFKTRDRRTALGTYSIDRNGDTTIRTYGVWTILHGRLHFYKAIEG
jgi:branched-chain amino acid transport system substrate-binding protein